MCKHCLWQTGLICLFVDTGNASLDTGLSAWDINEEEKPMSTKHHCLMSAYIIGGFRIFLLISEEELDDLAASSTVRVGLGCL